MLIGDTFDIVGLCRSPLEHLEAPIALREGGGIRPRTDLRSDLRLLALLAQFDVPGAQAQGLQANAPDRDEGRRVVGRPPQKAAAGQLEAGRPFLQSLEDRRLHIGGRDVQDILVGCRPAEADRALVGGRLGIDLRLDGRAPVLGQTKQVRL